ncbi:Uncharacterised protein at_DN1451, partial [Pycnogonum litorale]
HSVSATREVYSLHRSLIDKAVYSSRPNQKFLHRLLDGNPNADFVDYKAPEDWPSLFNTNDNFSSGLRLTGGNIHRLVYVPDEILHQRLESLQLWVGWRLLRCKNF